MKLYLAVTADEYELPVCVEEDYRILANKYGITPNNLLSCISHGCSGNGRGVTFIRVVIDEEPDIKSKRNAKPVKKKKRKIKQRIINNSKWYDEVMVFSDMEL